MEFEVLLSCMQKKEFSIIENSNLKCVKTLIVNQCDVDRETTVKINDLHTVINTKTRGLSVSRNLAIKNASADICLISDDDEVFCNDLKEKVCQAYASFPNADIIIFKMINYPTKLGSKTKRLKRLELLRVSSWQISFKTASIQNKLFFDIKLGAGTGNGAGEENKFLLDCFKNGLKIYYVPVEIASVAQTESTWFHGYNAKYFYNRGQTLRYILGLWMSIVYEFYFLLFKHSKKKKLSVP